MTTFASWIKLRRRALDLTPDELAAQIGYASLTLEKIERGQHRPSLELAARLAEALAIPAHERQRFLQLAGSELAQRAEPPGAPEPIRPQPAPAAPALVGREAERAALAERLRDGGQRLVTLIGPGGIGKTSLALRVAADLAGAQPFADGVAVALLAPIAAAADAPLAIGAALGLSIHGAQPAADQLIDALRDRALLLVLDNLEHLLGQREGATFVALIKRVLAEAPGVRMLATSRERLRLRDERVIDLGGLALPASDTSQRAERAAAVQLFAERARRVAGAFALDAGNRVAVARICRRLEGLPLAIELAASWMRALTPHEIAGEIERSLDFLAGDDRDLPDRHRSLRAALEHSWQLLDAAERHTLARLSVFRGGCDRAAAAEVVGASLPILSALIDKSLVRAGASAGVTRYSLHELVRQYAAERLATDPADQAATEARHAAYYADMLQRSIASQTGGAAPEAWAALIGNIDNLRAAWAWATANGDSATVMSMARGLMILYDSQGWLLDGATLLGRAADSLRAAAPEALAARGLVLGWQGYFLYRAGRLAEAAQQMEEGLRLAQASGSDEGLALLLLNLGAVEIFTGRFARAHEFHTRATQVAEAAGDFFTRLWVQFFQGFEAMLTGNLPAAERLLSACLEAWRSQQFSRGIGSSLLMLGETARLAGRPAEAEACVRESLRVSSATRDSSTIAACLRELGAQALARGELDEARYLLAESYEGMLAVGDMIFAGRSRAMLVRLEAQRGELAAARQGCAELLRSARLGLGLLLTEAAYGLALILEAEGSPAEALAVLLALASVPGEQATLVLAARMREALERKLGPEARAQAASLARDKQLLPWLEALCARLPAPMLAAPAPANDAPIVPSGALLVPDTGEMLSPREIEVLRLMIAGLGNQAIADALVISLHTAKKHVARVLEKLGASTRTQAALRGRALGLAPLRDTPPTR